MFSDVSMPGMDGAALAREIEPLAPDLPILLTSGHSNVLATEGAQGFDLLQKPYSVEKLSGALGQALQGRKSRAERR